MPDKDSTAQGTFWDSEPEKRCGRCKKLKPLTEFGKIKGRYRSYCRECHSLTAPDLRMEKLCARCKQVKPAEGFGRCGNRLQPYCKPCRVADTKERAEKRKANGTAQEYNKAAYKRYRRPAKLLKNYGITQEEYDGMVVTQGGVCAICKRPETEKGIDSLSVDHDHETGQVRGLLCRACNAALGRFSDDIGRLQAAIDYLRSHKGV